MKLYIYTVVSQPRKPLFQGPGVAFARCLRVVSAPTVQVHLHPAEVETEFLQLGANRGIIF
jgi:hypothetical protein